MARNRANKGQQGNQQEQVRGAKFLSESTFELYISMDGTFALFCSVIEKSENMHAMTTKVKILEKRALDAKGDGTFGIV